MPLSPGTASGKGARRDFDGSGSVRRAVPPARAPDPVTGAVTRAGSHRRPITRLTDKDWRTRHAAAEALARRDDEGVLLELVRPGTWLARPSRLRAHFDQASIIADQVYPRIPPSDKERLRRRLDHLTRRV
jgi:hypothetical protein